MRHSLLLPPLRDVIGYEGKGNFAIKKYYSFPFRFFYRMKFRMILDLLDKRRIYRSTLDYGSGPAQIFKRSLEARSWKVTCHDLDEAEPIGKFDLIVCASVLEFVDLKDAIGYFHKHIAIGGELIISSPMDTWLTRIYFKLIGDKNKRHSHKEIIKSLEGKFVTVIKKEWLGLYFSVKAHKI